MTVEAHLDVSPGKTIVETEHETLRRLGSGDCSYRQGGYMLGKRRAGSRI